MMKLSNYKPRIIDRTLSFYLKTFGAVLIVGPKWCGKTWTGRNACRSQFMLSDSTGNFNNRQMAMLNPDLALSGRLPRLIDEWQEVPLIWDAVRNRVDQNPTKGQFVLTGSAVVDRSKYLHSGTGRIARLRMRTMSLFESGDSDGRVSLEDICLGQAKDVFTGEVSLNRLLDYIIAGGFPARLGLDIKQSRSIANSYIDAIINEDIYRVDDVKRDGEKIRLLLKSLARNEATTASNATLKRDIRDKDRDDININTLTEYLGLLKKLYLIEDIPSFGASIRSSLRVKQSAKRHFVDPSLPSAVLGLTPKHLKKDLSLAGFLFESLVERDLLTYAESFGGKLFHYQDYKNNEIDAVIELEDGEWCGIEIKLGAHQIEEAAHNLLRINELIKEDGGKPAKSLCVLCGLSSAAYTRKDGVYVAPITSLRE